MLLMRFEADSIGAQWARRTARLRASGFPAFEKSGGRRLGTFSEEQLAPQATLYRCVQLSLPGLRTDGGGRSVFETRGVCSNQGPVTLDE